MAARIKLVVFDWAGTVIDHGCFAPVVGFTRLFAAHGVEASVAQARAPMGLEKRDHIRTMLQDATLASAWEQAHRAPWSERDVDRLYHDFVPLQMAALEEHSALVPGALEALDYLRKRDIKVAGTTGYFEAAALRVEELARRQGFVLDANAWARPGQPGRPAPWMIVENMRRLDIYPPNRVLKIGDTVHDILEGLNAGVWSAGVMRAGSALGLSAHDYDAMSPDERAARILKSAEPLACAGACATLDSLQELPALIEQIDAGSAGREHPST